MASSSATPPRSSRSPISPSSRSACSNVSSVDMCPERSLRDLHRDNVARLDLRGRADDRVVLPDDRVAALERRPRGERAEAARLALHERRLALDRECRRSPQTVTEDDDALAVTLEPPPGAARERRALPLQALDELAQIRHDELRGP